MLVTKMFDLSGKTALVVGGCGFLGSRFSEALAQAGAAIVIADLDEFSCEELAEYIQEETGVATLGIQTDITEKADVASLTDRAVAEFGQVGELPVRV